MTADSVTVRFYAAAADAAGTQQITSALKSEAVPLDEFLDSLPAELPAAENASVSLRRVCGASSFLINAVHATPKKATLTPGDTLDILPPFAGG